MRKRTLGVAALATSGIRRHRLRRLRSGGALGGPQRLGRPARARPAASWSSGPTPTGHGPQAVRREVRQGERRHRRGPGDQQGQPADNFVTASQQGSGPDVVVGAHDWIGNLVQNGAIDPVQLTDEQKAAFTEIAVKAVTFDGQLYGVPYAIENLALIRNTDLAPDAPATIEDLVKARQAAQGATARSRRSLCLPVGAEGRRLPHLPDLHLGRRLPLRRHRQRRLRPQATWASASPSSVEAFGRSPRSARRATAC